MRKHIVWAAAWGEKWDAISGDEALVRLDTEIAQLEARLSRATNINAHFKRSRSYRTTATSGLGTAARE